MLKLLGRLQDQSPVTMFNPIHNYVNKELNKRAKDFTSKLDLSVYASTFNVNGSVYEGDIDKWIYPEENDYDLIFIGLQEIVVLNAGQMVNTDFEIRPNGKKDFECVAKTEQIYGDVEWPIRRVALYFL